MKKLVAIALAAVLSVGALGACEKEDRPDLKPEKNEKDG
jgi:hypothetical protein